MVKRKKKRGGIRGLAEEVRYLLCMYPTHERMAAQIDNFASL